MERGIAERDFAVAGRSMAIAVEMSSGPRTAFPATEETLTPLIDTSSLVRP